MREWTGRPYNSEQREFAQYEKIGLQHITMTYGSDDAVPQVWIDNKKVPVEVVAKNDGLSVENFVEWFFGNSKSNVFEGVIVHFLRSDIKPMKTDLGKPQYLEYLTYLDCKSGRKTSGIV